MTRGWSGFVDAQHAIDVPLDVFAVQLDLDMR
jgi:hypothetical protein